MGLKTIKMLFEEYGDAQCKSKIEFEQYIQRYTDLGVNIYTTILTLEKLASDEKLYDNLFRLSPAFFNSVFYNFWAMAVIHLNAFFSKGDSCSLYKFIEFLDSNHESIFTKKFYDEIIGGEDVGKRYEISMKSYKTSREIFNSYLKQNSELLKKMRVARNKIFAHFDRDYLICQQCVLTSLSLDELKQAINLIQSLVNIYAVLYDRCERSFESINATDIYQTAFGIELYLENKHELINKKYDIK